MSPQRRSLLLLVAAALALSGCDSQTSDQSGQSHDTQHFPAADRPVAPIISTRWSNEETRDRRHEAAVIMDQAGIKPGMTVADIGAGEGYYTVRLAKRVGPHGRVLAEDIVSEVIDALARRVTHDSLDNVSVKLGTPDDPQLPANSFDRVFMVHMYHEIAQPYAFLWNLYPALKRSGEIVVVESDRPTAEHGTPPLLLRCEFEAVGFRFLGMSQRPAAGGYMARFGPGAQRIAPQAIKPCRLQRQ